MDRRQALVVVVRVFACVALVVFTIPFLSVFLGDQESGSGANRLFIDVSDLQTGRPRFVEVAANRPLILLRPDPQQRRDLALLSAHVWTAANANDPPIYVYWGLSTGKFGGCQLQHKPVIDAPQARTGLRPGWRGGYWAPGCEASYDYAGRPIKTRHHAYSDYVAKSRQLRSPPFELLEGGRLAITIKHY